MKKILPIMFVMTLLCSCNSVVENADSYTSSITTDTSQSQVSTVTTSNQIINTNEIKYDFDFDGVYETCNLEYGVASEKMIIIHNKDNNFIGEIAFDGSKKKLFWMPQITLYYDESIKEYFYVSEYDCWNKLGNSAEINKYVFKDNTIEITNIAHCEFETLGYLPDNSINIVSNTLLGEPTTPIGKQNLDELKHYYDGVDKYLSQFKKIKTVNSKNSSFTDSTEEAILTDSNICTESSKNNIQQPISCAIPDEELIWKGSELQKELFLNDTDLELLPNAIITQCVKKLNCDELSCIKVALWDMNSDGIDDYFVLPFPNNYARNSLPPLYLFISEMNSYKIIATPLKADNVIKILNSKTNGYYDIQWDMIGNILSFNGLNEYKGQQDSAISTNMFPIKVDGNTVCIKVSIPYGKPEYDKYCIKACLFKNDFENALIVTSNDKQFNDIVYAHPPTNGTYYFYVKYSDLNNLPLDDILIEFQYVEVLEN